MPTTTLDPNTHQLLVEALNALVDAIQEVTDQVDNLKRRVERLEQDHGYNR